MAVTKKQANSLMKQAKSIQKTFDKVKGKMTQSQMNKASASLSKATAGVKDLNKRQNASRVERAIPATDIGTTSPVIPPKPQVPDTGDMLGMNNASVLQEGLTLDGGQFVKDPNASDVMNATKEANVNMGNIASQVLGYLQPQENQMQNAYEDTYGITSRQAGREYRRAQQEVQQYTSQLNNITTNRDASILALEDTGRGQTSGFIGGEQGRIQRQAAIAALPVQAQLAAAQGNLEIAKSHVDSLFQMKIKDIETEQAYKQTVANTWMSVANTQQSNLLNAAIADSNARAEAKKTAMNDAKQIAMQAIEYGQSSLAASVMRLDPTSPTYQQDVMNAMAGLRKPVVATQAEAPKLQNFGTTDAPNWRQYNPATGSWDEVGGITPPVTPATQDKAANQLDFMLGTINKAEKFSGASGDTGIGGRVSRWLFGSDDYTNLVAETNTLRTNMLTLATDPTIKKFFGPQMSNADVQLMTSAGTTLNPELQSPTQMKDEIARIKDFTERAKLSVQGVTQFGKTDNGVRVGVFPDGTVRDVNGNVYDENGNTASEEENKKVGFFDSFLSVFGLGK